MNYLYECKRCGTLHNSTQQVDSIYCTCAWRHIEVTLITPPVVTCERLADLTDLITVEDGARRYYWHLGQLHYSRVEDGHATRRDVVSVGARQEVKRMIDNALDCNVNMPDSNEDAIAGIQAVFG